jgi:hypothetical protein
MLPNLRVILVATAATATVVTLVGTALRPVSGDAGAPRVAQRPSWQTSVDNSRKLQFHMLGYAYRADEPNRQQQLSQSPAPMKDETSAQEGGTSIYIKQGGDAAQRAALAGEHPANNSNDPSADAGLVTGGTSASTNEPAASATHDNLLAPASIASAQPAGSSPVIALPVVPLPPERPKHLRPPIIHAVRAAAGANNIFAPQDRNATP